MLCDDAQQLAGAPHNRGGGRIGHRWGRTNTPHSITHGDACFAYFNKIWGIPCALSCARMYKA